MKEAEKSSHLVRLLRKIARIVQEALLRNGELDSICVNDSRRYRSSDINAENPRNLRKLLELYPK